MGIKYAMLLIVTAARSMALKAEVLPKYKQLNAAMTVVTRSCVLKGTLHLLLTFAQVLDQGIAPSRAKAYRTREVDSWEETTQGPRAMKRMNVSPKAPPTD